MTPGRVSNSRRSPSLGSLMSRFVLPASLCVLLLVVVWKTWRSIVLCFVRWLVEFASADPLSPVIHFAKPRLCLEDIRDNLRSIQDEIVASLPYADDIQDDGFFNSSITNDRKWEKIYLKWYTRSPAYAYRLFPVTMAIIDRHADVRLAMVSVLRPGARVHPHCGPYRGSIRVHVSVQTPNSPRCYIDIGGHRHVYRDDNIVAFDDTYEHSVTNDTDQSRVVLFLDIDRRMTYKWAQSILNCVSLLIGITAPQHVNRNIALQPPSGE